MMIGFDATKQNLGSSKKLFQYLDKENKGKEEDEKDKLFNQDREDITPEEATEAIDKNIAKLGKDEQKYFSLHISPSAEEISTINGDVDKMKEYVRSVMDEYAKNFNKGLTGDDLLYYAKVERTRAFKSLDMEVKENFVKDGTKKMGDQMHVHIVVSRKDRSNTIKLSPKDNSKGGTNFKVPGKDKTITRGFDRNKFINKAERVFDEKFNYVRPAEQSFEYRRLREHHPHEFRKQYGKETTKNISISKKSEWKWGEKNYVQKHVDNAFNDFASKKDISEALASKGIAIKTKGVMFDGNFMPYNQLALSQTSVDGINTMYITNKKNTPYRHIDVKNVRNEFSKREYVEVHINKILTKGQMKNEADKYLKDKGIMPGPNGFKVNGKEVPTDKLNLQKDAAELLKAFYLTKQFARNIEGKDEEKERER